MFLCELAFLALTVSVWRQRIALWLWAQWGATALICVKGPTVLPTITSRSSVKMSVELKKIALGVQL